MSIDIVTAFTGKNILEASKALLAQLNVAIHTKTTSPVRQSELSPVANKAVAAALSKVSELYYVGYVGEESFGGNFKKLPDDYRGMMVFAVEAKGSAALVRGDLSAITRALNRLSKCAPVLLVAREGDTFSLAVAERTSYVRASMRGEKAGRVVMLRRISVSSPHRGHIDILQRIAAHGTTTYEDFYRYLIDNVLSVSVLTKQFYREIQNWYFWALKKDNGVRFPNDLADDSDDEKYNAENMIRLITRLMFTWFMKEKGLVNPELFDTAFLSKALKHFAVGHYDPIAPQSCTYYRAILQNLFFATFNQEIPRRCFIDSKVLDKKRHEVKNYYRNARFFTEKDEHKIIGYFSTSPFVNGGLFECLDEVKQNGKTYSWDGFSNNDHYGKMGNHPREWDGSLKTALIPDRLFFGGEMTVDLSEFFEKDKSAKTVKVRGIINILKDYVFTIEENTPLDEDVALDPELLGKVFENLLGCYNEETGQMARNATGSFYTPREIVNYMVKVSLKSYLKRTCPKVVPAEVDALVDGTAELSDMPSVKEYAKDILTALFKAKILDPACGSGAFPMGIMSAMVDVLRSVDPDNKYWYEIVLKESLDEAAAIADVSDEQERAELKAQIEYDFKERVDHPDYARKLYIIEHCIFGSDIQPIAVQISRLRFFITLLCEQTKNDDPTKNYGITPLPNLESNFVAANSLLSIDLKDMRELLGEKKIVKLVRELRGVRHQLFLPKTSDKKKRLQEKDAKLRESIAAAAEGLYDTQLKDNVALIEKELKRIDSDLAALTPDDRKDTVKTVRDDLFDETITRTIVSPSKEKLLLRRRRDAETRIYDIQNDSRKKRLLNNVKRLVAWNPFAFNIAESFLDPEWMFDVKRGFDVVIGNPPYISAPMQIANAQLKAQREFLSKCGRFKTLIEKWDLYIPFIELGTQLCVAGGITSMIVPYPLTNQKYGLKMRRYLVEEHDLLELVDLCGTKVFESATVSNCIVFERKRDGRTCRDHFWISHIDETRQIHHAFQKTFADLVQDPKTLVWNTTAEKREAARHADLHILGDYCYISVGMVLNADEKTAKGEFTKDDLISDTKDKVHCREYIEGKDVGLYFVKNFRFLEYGTDRCPGKLRRQTFTDFYPPRKILTNQLGELCCTLDENGFLFNHTVRGCVLWRDLRGIENKSISVSVKKFCKMTRREMEALSEVVDLRFLLGVMNSRYGRLLLQSIRGGDICIYPEHIRNIPVPSATPAQQKPIIALVDRILAAKKANSSTDTSALEVEIDILVYHLYGFTDKEIDAMTSCD